jgi:head-tail adaptor
MTGSAVAGPMIPEAELVTLREAADPILDQTCSILRLTETDDDGGGTIESYNPVATGVPCAFREVSTTGESVIAAQIKAGGNLTVLLRTSTDIRDTDRILAQGHTLEVEGVIWPESYPILRRAVCKRIS